MHPSAKTSTWLTVCLLIRDIGDSLPGGLGYGWLRRGPAARRRLVMPLT